LVFSLAGGYPADEILSKADEFNCDVIFMGTHSKGFLKHSYFGSTAKKVLRRKKKPVFIVPLSAGETDITIHDL
jgi:nucleotide-binding universal stress UspA family protein